MEIKMRTATAASFAYFVERCPVALKKKKSSALDPPSYQLYVTTHKSILTLNVRLG